MERRGHGWRRVDFKQRIAVHRALDWMQIESSTILEGLRGLGIETRAVKALAAVGVVARYVKIWTSVSGDATVVRSDELKRLMHAVFDLSPGWNRVAQAWVYCEHSADKSRRASVDGHTEIIGSEDDLWAIVTAEFQKKLPCAVLTETRENYLRIEADRPSNVRALTSSERELGDRVGKYVDARESVSILLYGPQGSAKTTAACSIAQAYTGGYFRLSAEYVSRSMTYALVKLSPPAVVVDDIDRVNDVALLEMLDALTGAGLVTFCTSNTAPDNRHGDQRLMDAALVRSSRLDIHQRIDRLDGEAHEEIRKAVGLTGVDLGPDGGEMLASDLACLGRMHRSGDLADPRAAVADLLKRRSNTSHTLRVVQPQAFVKSHATRDKDCGPR